MHFPDLQVKELGLHAVPVKKTEKTHIITSISGLNESSKQQQ